MSNITIHGRIEKEHINDVIEIDKFWFNKEPTATYWHWVEEKPELYSILTNNGKVEGYALIIPVDSFAHQALKKGDMEEDELKIKYISSLDECSGIYIASVATTPTTKPHIRRQVVGLAEGQVLRPKKELFAIAVSQSGESIAKELQMTSHQYSGSFVGIENYQPKLFTKQAFVF